MKNTLMKSALALATTALFAGQAMAEIQIVRNYSQFKTTTTTTTTITPHSEVSTNSATPSATTVVSETIKESVKDGEFNAPSYATTVSAANKGVFNVQIPNYSTSIKLKKPPYYVGCFYSSSRKYGVPVDLLMAIAQTESSFNHKVTGKIGYGADHGLMQINDYWVPKLRKRFNITLSDIYEPCTNIEIASWILAHNFIQFGYSWRAVGAYNAVTEWKRVRYINKVAANLKKLHAGQI